MLPEALNRLSDEVLDNLNRSLAQVLDEIEVSDQESAMKPLSELISSDLSPNP